MTRYLNLGEYLWLAEQVTGVDAAVLSKASRADLADSALHAPQASFGGIEFYETLSNRAEPPWVSWRLQTLDTRIESCRRT